MNTYYLQETKELPLLESKKAVTAVNPLLAGTYGLKQIVVPVGQNPITSSPVTSWFSDPEWELASGSDLLALQVYDYLGLSNAQDVDGGAIASPALWFQGLGALADRAAHCVLTKDCTLQIYRSIHPMGQSMTFNVEIYMSGHILVDGSCECRLFNDYRNRVASLYCVTTTCLRATLRTMQFVALVKRR